MAAPLEASSGLTNEVNAQVVAADNATVHNVPEPPPGDTFAAQSNQIDPAIYRSFILVGETVWDTSMRAGHLIYKMRIHPECNPHTNYLSAEYISWDGGFELAAKIGGTGFNGGQLMIVHVPPNLDPDDLSEQQLTGFDYVTMDPKEQGYAVFDGYDQRNVMFHYLREFNPKSGVIEATNSHGGWLVVKVLLPLIASNQDNTSRVSISFFTRPAPSFSFHQLCVPTIEWKQPKMVYKMVLGDRHPILPYPVTKIRCSTDTTRTNVGVVLAPAYGVSKVTHIGPFENNLKPGGSSSSAHIAGWKYKPRTLEDKYLGDIPFCASQKWIPATSNSAQFIWYSQNNLTRVRTLCYNRPTTSFNDWYATGDQYLCGYDDSQGLKVDSFSFAALDGTWKTVAEPSPTVTVKVDAPKNEALVDFLMSAETNNGALTTSAVFTQACHLQMYSDLKPGESILFKLVSNTTKQPLTHIRYMRDGYFTCPKGKTAKSYNLYDVHLVFQEVVPVYQELPQPSQANISLHEALAGQEALRARVDELSNLLLGRVDNVSDDDAGSDSEVEPTESTNRLRHVLCFDPSKRCPDKEEY